jgi:N,N'-diacetylchitobiose phosphorylase
VKNPAGVEKGVKCITLNGKTVNSVIPVQPVGSVSEVEVVMGH